jgi:dCTP deaminase
MLSADELVSALKPQRRRGVAPLIIVPIPDLDALVKRGAASVDLRLGRWFRSFKQTAVESFSLVGPNADQSVSKISRTRQHFVPFGTKFVLHPGRFVLGATLEWLRLSAGLTGYVTGRSSLGRHGLIIETAAGIHPGFSGCLTLELANVGEVPLEIYPGMHICQIFFHRTANASVLTAGSLSGSRKPILKDPSPDRVFQKLRAV